jgi:DNA mismatch endonuclease (patch repair protein)
MVSARMSRHPRRDTGPELAIRRALHSAGLRYRLQVPVPGRPRRTIDIAFPRQRLAVFVDGCFWHACSEHRSDPVANSAFWRAKLDGNVARDAETDALLLSAGWHSVRIWEHEPVAAAVERVRVAVTGLRTGWD